MLTLRSTLLVVFALLLTLASAPASAGTGNDSTPAAKPVKKRLTVKKGPVTRLQPIAVAPAKDVMHNHQPIMLAGWVTGVDGMPLPGATVWLTNTHGQPVVTNRAGDFLLNLPNNAPVSLTIGCAGYQDQVVMLNQPRQQNGVSVALQELARRR